MLRYPLSLSGNGQASVIFSGNDSNGNQVKIALYMPNNFTVTDGAAYSDFDLGVLGKSGAAAVEYLIGGEGMDSKKLEAELNRATGADDPTISGTMSTLLNSQIMSNFGMGSGLVDRGRDLYLQDAKKAINPNTVLQYTNSALRTYNFQCKMVAESKEEEQVIRKIINSFRKYMYAEKADGDKTLSYPLKWEISFLTPQGLPNNKLPKPYDCYLESLSAVYNATGNSFHVDGSAVEIDIALGFKETKALAREEIVKLQFDN